MNSNEAKPKVSVVIPTYNRPDLILDAVQSVFRQTFQDFEIVIVDDGSQQPVVFEGVSGDSRIRIIRHEQNRGPAAARNTGIRASRGDLIAFLDSDDLWLPDKLAKQVALMRDQPRYVACVTGFRYETEEGTSVEIPPRPHSWVRELSKGCAISPGTTLVVRRGCYEKVGYYNETLPRHEDFEWLLRFSSVYDIGVVPMALAVVRRSGQPHARVIEIANNFIVEKYRHVFLAQGRFFGHQVIGKRWLETSIHWFMDGDRNKGWMYLLKSIQENPLQRPSMYLRVVDLILGTSFYLFLKRFWLSIRRSR